MKVPKYTREVLKVLIQAETTDSVIGGTANKMLRELESGDKICLLRKALYDLRQAGRCWNTRLNQILLRSGARPSIADPYVYYKKQGLNLLVIIVYVDDIVVASQDDSSIGELERHLSEELEIKDFGP